MELYIVGLANAKDKNPWKKEYRWDKYADHQREMIRPTTSGWHPWHRRTYWYDKISYPTRYPMWYYQPTKHRPNEVYYKQLLSEVKNESTKSSVANAKDKNPWKKEYRWDKYADHQREMIRPTTSGWHPWHRRTYWALPRREDAITLKQAFHLLTRKQWLNLNLHILISFFVYLAVMSLHIFRVTKYFPHNTLNISTEVENVVFWVYLGTPCWIFAVITKALESLVDACFYELKEARGDIDAAIKIYSELCRQIFSTSRTFKYWFVIHWFGFGVTFAVDAAMGVMMVSESNPYVSWIFISTWLFIIIHTFLYPTEAQPAKRDKNKMVDNGTQTHTIDVDMDDEANASTIDLESEPFVVGGIDFGITDYHDAYRD
ncbi:hypothetical protein QZH41_002849, partial [Actinostola sp. cb2023]